jgi:hypothetical protein
VAVASLVEASCTYKGSLEDLGSMAVEIVVGKVVGKVVARVVVLDTQEASPLLRDAVEYLCLISLNPRPSWIFTREHLFFFASNAQIVFVVVVLVVKVRRISVIWSFRRIIISQNGTFSLDLFC